MSGRSHESDSSSSEDSTESSTDSSDSSSTSESSLSSVSSTSSSSSDTDSTTTSTSSNTATPQRAPPRRYPKENLSTANSSTPAAAPKLGSSGEVLDVQSFQKTTVGCKVSNTTLQYRYPDSAPILVKGHGLDMNRLFTGLHRFTLVESRQYKIIDLFVVATELFLQTLIEQNAVQQQRPGSGPTRRFTWANGGGLAISFAQACDCAKQLCDVLVLPQQQPEKVSFEHFMGAYLRYLQSASGISDEILSLKTYDTKFKDWKKGGTRYTSSSTSKDYLSNVRFPSAQQRRERLESFIAGGSEVKIESKVVVVDVDKAERVANAISSSGHTRASALPSLIRGGSSRNLPTGTVRTVQQNPWKRSLFALFGGVVLAYPANKIAVMSGFVRLAEKAPDKNDKKYVLRLLTSSGNQLVLNAFDEQGGLAVIRTWTLAAASSKDIDFVGFFLEFMSNRYSHFTSRTRDTWLKPFSMREDAQNPETSTSYPNSVYYLRAVVNGHVLERYLNEYLASIGRKFNSEETPMKIEEKAKEAVDEAAAVEDAESEKEKLDRQAEANLWQRQQLLSRMGWGGGRSADLPLLNGRLPFIPTDGTPLTESQRQAFSHKCVVRQMMKRQRDSLWYDPFTYLNPSS